MGFVEETGAARLLRDSRIAPIYEGTNGIQAIDLVTRKLPLSDGAAMTSWLRELRAIADEAGRSNRPGVPAATERLLAALDDAGSATAFLVEAMKAGDMRTALAGATPYLRLIGLAATGAYLAKGAILEQGGGRRAALFAFAACNLIGETSPLRRCVEEGAESLASAGGVLAAEQESP